jgi:hypothetical protein
MCVYVYISSAKTLPLKTLEPGTRPFKIEHLQRVDRPVRKHLKKRHLYFAASFEGCGCVFAAPSAISSSSGRYFQRCRSSVKGLSRYLADAVERAGEIQVYAVDNRWLGRRPRSRRVIDASKLRSPGFRLRENELVTIS